MPLVCLSIASLFVTDAVLLLSFLSSLNTPPLPSPSPLPPNVYLQVVPELLYLNYKGVSQTADPTPPPEDHVYHTLPEGWEEDHDAEGDPFCE